MKNKNGLVTTKIFDDEPKLELGITLEEGSHAINETISASGEDYEKAYRLLLSNIKMNKDYAEIPYLKEHMDSLYNSLLKGDYILNKNYNFTVEKHGFKTLSIKTNKESNVRNIIPELESKITPFSTIIHYKCRRCKPIELSMKIDKIDEVYFAYLIVSNQKSADCTTFTNIPTYKETWNKLMDCYQRMTAKHGLTYNNFLSIPRYNTVDFKGNINYLNKYISLSIEKRKEEDYYLLLNCNLLGRRFRKAYHATTIIAAIDTIVYALLDELESKQIVSVVDVYNRCLFEFDNAMLFGHIREHLLLKLQR
jgi:hypothetical protein